MKNTLIDAICDQLNLKWAWQKAKKYAINGDYWYNEFELNEFELNLESNLETIRTKLKNGNYVMEPLKPIAFPKTDNKKGKHQSRQVFSIAIIDQVAWMAIINVIGYIYDQRMPNWSYGNRLYRTKWIEEHNGIRVRKIGRYRNSSGQLYLKFHQSWSIYRRHIVLTIRAMSKESQLTEIDEKTEEELALNDKAPNNNQFDYLRREYWANTNPPQGARDSLYWCTLDFAKFFPSLRTELIQQNLLYYCPSDWKSELNDLLNVFLQFEYSASSWTKNDLRKIGLLSSNFKYEYLPTGLFVAGFLANVALLSIDNIVQNKLQCSSIAHFRYVDDHVIIAYSYDDLYNWVKWYVEVLEHENTGIKVNFDKVEPAAFSKHLKGGTHSKSTSVKKLAMNDCKLDPKYPSPLMTKTLQLISNIATTEFELLDSSELDTINTQVEHLLLVDLDDSEVQEKTRLSFAAGKIIKIASLKQNCHSEILSQQIALLKKTNERKALIEEQKKEQTESKIFEISERLSNCQKQIEKLNTNISNQEDAHKINTNRSFNLVIKALDDRSDRTRLWLRAVEFSRITGTQEVKRLFDKVIEAGKDNKLQIEYLLAILYMEIANQLLIAAIAIRSTTEPQRRVFASLCFINQFSRIDIPNEQYKHNYYSESLDSMLISYYLTLDMVSSEDKESFLFNRASQIEKNDKLFERGYEKYREFSTKKCRSILFWWIYRHASISSNDSIIDYFKRKIDSDDNLNDSFEFFRYFPSCVPTNKEEQLAKNDFINRTNDYGVYNGWWYEYLFTKYSNDHTRTPGSLVPPLLYEALKPRDKYINLYEWCQYWKQNRASEFDPRRSEWTALFFVKSFLSEFTVDQTFSLDNITSFEISDFCLHPSSCLIRKDLLNKDRYTWEQWRSVVNQPDSIKIVDPKNRIADYRYQPISKRNSYLSQEINNLRTFGLILFGLLRYDFSLPPLWNGIGQSDLLPYVSFQLQNTITISSWTIGILSACLSPRAIENKYLYDQLFDDDTTNDPPKILNLDGLQRYISKTIFMLEKCQISSFNHNARQLIPINVRQLTKPEWDKDFNDINASIKDDVNV